MIIKILQEYKDIFKLLLSFLDDKSAINLTTTCKLLYQNANLVTLKGKYPAQALMTPWRIESLYCEKAILEIPIVLNDANIIQVNRIKNKYSEIKELTIASYDRRLSQLPKSLQILNIQFSCFTYNEQHYIYKLIRDRSDIQIILPKNMQGEKFLRNRENVRYQDPEIKKPSELPDMIKMFFNF